MELYAAKPKLSNDFDNFKLDLLPPELQVHVFSQLDIRTLGGCSSICKNWNDLISDDQGLWRFLCHRDYLEYIDTKPFQAEQSESKAEDMVSKLSTSILHNPIFVQLAEAFTESSDEDEGDDMQDDVETAESNTPSPENSPTESRSNVSIVTRPESLSQNQQQAIQNSFHTLSRKAKKARLNTGVDLTIQPRKWKDFYKECHSKVNFNGIWYGKYGGHGEEQVMLSHRGFNLSAVKITGDANVPAGKQTWWMNLDRDLAIGEGEIHLADTGYKNPRWGKATISIVDRDHFNVTWSHLYWTFPLPFERASAREEKNRKEALESASSSARCPYLSERGVPLE